MSKFHFLGIFGINPEFPHLGLNVCLEPPLTQHIMQIFQQIRS